MNFDTAHKDKIGKQLAISLAQGLKEGKITLKESPVISSYILDNIDKITDSSQLIEFLKKLSEKWPIFANTLTLEKGEVEEVEEEKTAKKATDLIKENKIDEALKTIGETTKKEEKD
ncbi:MAG TPA: hypothetical protein VMW29_03275 [Candidatus Bathyarchaeia archaeon]|nr:hypothetical protein [Candidatus Bathyarchaeia archaeon]